MEFSPQNDIVKRCLLGINAAEHNENERAVEHFQEAWQVATADFEKYLAAYFLARYQKEEKTKISWLHTVLEFANKLNNPMVQPVFQEVYLQLATCYSQQKDEQLAQEFRELAANCNQVPTDTGPFYHGTRADLKVGDELLAGGKSNYKADLTMNHIYFTAMISGAGLAAELAKGDAEPRIYSIEPTGSFECDPNVTNKKFPGNPTRSYRSAYPLKIVGEVKDWPKLPEEVLKQYRAKLADNKGEIVN